MTTHMAMNEYNTAAIIENQEAQNIPENMTLIQFTCTPRAVTRELTPVATTRVSVTLLVKHKLTTNTTQYLRWI